MSEAMQRLQDQIGAIAEGQIKPLFAPQFHGQMKITVLVRFADAPDCDVLVTGDDDAGIRAIVGRRTQGGSNSSTHEPGQSTTTGSDT